MISGALPFKPDAKKPIEIDSLRRLGEAKSFVFKLKDVSGQLAPEKKRKEKDPSSLVKKAQLQRPQKGDDVVHQARISKLLERGANGGASSSQIHVSQTPPVNDPNGLRGESSKRPHSFTPKEDHQQVPPRKKAKHAEHKSATTAHQKHFTSSTDWELFAEFQPTQTIGSPPILSTVKDKKSDKDTNTNTNTSTDYSDTEPDTAYDADFDFQISLTDIESSVSSSASEPKKKRKKGLRIEPESLHCYGSLEAELPELPLFKEEQKNQRDNIASANFDTRAGKFTSIEDAVIIETAERFLRVCTVRPISWTVFDS